jgi:UDP-N-acetylglucosamine--N-acetylmuramyl-(pentapeptide) pyrophosphoryl-undecaprenol N-acetylglucosamine transferase
MSGAVILAGGGTGGHLFPALAVARALGLPVVFIGSLYGMERDLVPRHGFPFRGLPIRGFVGVPAWKQAARLPMLAWSLVRALLHFLALRPRVVLGFGGYASVPALAWARFLRVPYFLQEQNSVPGVVTRRFAAGARAVFTAYPDLPLAGTQVLTGNPVREEIRAVPPLEAPRPPLRVLVLGGSQGAGFLNRLFAEAAPALAGLSVELLHQTGPREEEAVRAAYAAAGLGARTAVFIDRMDEAYAWAHLVVCRSGAMTVAEVTAAGRPAHFVPFAGATHGHQLHNARSLSGRGAAFLTEERDMTPGRLEAFLREVLADPEALAAMSRRLKALDDPGGLARICEALRRAAGGNHELP